MLLVVWSAMEKTFVGFLWSLSWSGQSRLTPAAPLPSLLACSVLPPPDTGQRSGLPLAVRLRDGRRFGQSPRRTGTKPGSGLLIRCSLTAYSGQPGFETQLCQRHAGTWGAAAFHFPLSDPRPGAQGSVQAVEVALRVSMARLHRGKDSRQEDRCHCPAT